MANTNFLNPDLYAPPLTLAQPPQQPAQSLRYKLRELLLTHSSEEIYTTLRALFHEDYAFYTTLFTHAPAPAPAPAVPAVPAGPSLPVVLAVPLSQFEVAQAEEPQLSTMRSAKIRIVKKEPEVNPNTVEAVVVEPKAEAKTTEAERKAQIKREQAQKVSEKYAELVAKKVAPQTLLTEENLRRWISAEGLTYTQIARDHVGLPAEQIAKVASGLGFQSPIAKRRADIIAGKARS